MEFFIGTKVMMIWMNYVNDVSLSDLCITLPANKRPFAWFKQVIQGPKNVIGCDLIDHIWA